DVGRQQRALRAGRRRSGLSRPEGRGGRQLCLLCRLRPAGAEARAEGQAGEEEVANKKAGVAAGFSLLDPWDRQFSFAFTSAMPLASRSSATDPFTDCESTLEAAATAASAAAARTSASAWASARAILFSAVLVRRATKSSIRVLASAAMRSASALALVTISCASRSALARRA